jgi:aspartate-semialdehyde dehydrogenase
MAAPSVATIVGADSLIGREVNELLEQLGTPVEVRAVSSEPGVASMVLDPAEDESEVLAPLTPEKLAGSDVVFLAGMPGSAQKVLDMLDGHGGAVIDLTAGLEDNPRARLRAPLVEAPPEVPADAVHVIAHPAAIALALFYGRIARRHPMSRAVVHVLEPASARGQRGITELQKQAVSLLSFKPMPKEVFDAQLGFNLLAEYGAEAPEPLSGFEQRVERHLATLLANSGLTPMPSLRMIQAPVFHGYSLSIWTEFERNPGADVLRHSLASESVDIRGDQEEAPNIVGIAGQSGIAIGDVRVDRNNANACWFWLVADNLRIQAAEAVAVAKEFL